MGSKTLSTAKDDVNNGTTRLKRHFSVCYFQCANLLLMDLIYFLLKKVNDILNGKRYSIIVAACFKMALQ